MIDEVYTNQLAYPSVLCCGKLERLHQVVAGLFIPNEPIIELSLFLYLIDLILKAVLKET